MIDLLACQSGDVANFYRQKFLQNRDIYSSFEAAAQGAALNLFTLFQTNNEPLFALARIFRTFHRRDLPTALASQANPKINRWLLLMGTYGLEAHWRERHHSQQHFILPLEGDISPMFKAAFGGIQIQVGDILPERQRGQALTEMFYVENAENHPVISAQKEFVQPYGIRSVIGLGTTFLSGESFLAIFFSRQPINPEQARYFSEISPFISTLLAIYDEKPLFIAE